MSTPLPTTSTSLTETKGDLFASPDYSVLVHACNCQGAWGKGIAKRFRELYPAAYAIYRAHCLTSLAGTSPTPHGRDEQKRALLGTALLIPPQLADLPRKHWIGCLFTRWHYRGKGDVQGVLEATRGAVRDLVRLVRLEEERREERGEGVRIGEVYACRINAGCFGVEWGETRRVLVEEGLGWRVVEFDGVGEGEGEGRGGRGRRGKWRMGVREGEGEGWGGRGRRGKWRMGVREEREGEDECVEREEGLVGGECGVEGVGRKGDGLCAEKVIGDGGVDEDAAFGRVGFVSSSAREALGGRMHDGEKVDARRGKRRRLV